MSSEHTPGGAINTLHSDGALRPAAVSTRRLTGLEINLIPDEIDARLHPKRAAEDALWHRAQAGPSALVSLWSQVDRLRVVQLTARGDTRGWNPAWVRWTYAVRRPLSPDSVALADTPGQGLDTQAILDNTTTEDLLSEDETVLTLTLLPGEQRDVSLEFRVFLDGETAAGDYAFAVVVTEITDAEPIANVENVAGAVAATAAQDEDAPVQTIDGILRLRHPGATLLKYLPEIYTPQLETPLNRRRLFTPYEEPPFFERFLRGFQDADEPLQARLAHIERLFDAMQAPADLLPWLATWVALALDENWPELKRRRLIREAVELYRWRGTRRGLTRYLEIYVGVTPQISDKPLFGMRLGASAVLGRDARLGDVPPHTFVVNLVVHDPAAINEAIVRAIIESVKPAHAAYQLRIVQDAAPQSRTTLVKRK